MKPFVKWAGGKTQFLEIINLLLPNDYNQFIEPFVGGGAALLSIQPKKVIIYQYTVFGRPLPYH
jgi:DNA adenine methylase